MDNLEDRIVTSVDDIISYYCSKNKEKKLRIGIEWERSGIYRDTLKPVEYEGPTGYLAVLKKLVSEVGWEIIEGHRKNIFELQRGAARITTESDGRLELSGSPQKNLHDLAREFRLHANEVEEIGRFFNIAWIPLGMQPLHSNSEIKLIEKDRYQVLLRHGQAPYMETQQKRNNGLTANFSVLDEENAIQKAQIAFRIMPIISAIFASSPFDEGKLSGSLDHRRECIMQFYPGRVTIPREILKKNFSYKKWIENYFDIPVLVIKRKDKPDIWPDNLLFRTWMMEGYEGIYPTLYDFDQHVKATWADIRLRPGYLEYRVADTVPFRMVMAVPALIKGLVFSSNSWKAIEDMTKGWTYDDIIEADRRSWKEGLKTEIHGKSLLCYAQELITLANDQLHLFGRINGIDASNDESVFLRALKEQIYIKEKSLAEELAGLWETEWNKDPRRLVEWCEQE